MRTTNVMGRVTSQRLAIALIAVAAMLGAIIVLPGPANANPTAVSIDSGSQVVLGVTVAIADAACADGVNNDPNEDMNIDLNDTDCSGPADNGEHSMNGDTTFQSPTYANFSSSSADDWDVDFSTDTQESCVNGLGCLHVQIEGSMTGSYDSIGNQFHISLDGIVTLTNDIVGYAGLTPPCQVVVANADYVSNTQSGTYTPNNINPASSVAGVIGCGAAWKTIIQAALGAAALGGALEITVTP